MGLPQLGVEAVFKMDQFRRGAQEYDKAIDSADRKTARSTKAMSAKFAGFASAATAAIGLTITGLAKLSDAVVKTGLEAGRIIDLQQSFVNLSRSVGVSATQLLADLRRVSRGTISNTELIEIANSALISRNEELAKNLPKLYQISEAAARATGQQVQHVFKTLVRGILKASPLLIDNAEIYVKVGNAVDEYAAKTNRAAEDLSLFERQVAVMTAVTAQGGEVLEAAGGVAASATDPFKKLTSDWDMMTQGLKVSMLPLLEALAKRLQSLVFIAKSVGAGFIAASEGLAIFFETGLNVDKAYAAFQERFDEVFQMMSGNIVNIEATTNAFSRNAEKMSEIAKKADELKDKLGTLNEEWSEKSAAAAQASLHQWENIIRQRGRVMEDAARRLGWRLEDLGRARNKDLAKLEKEHGDAIAQIRQDAAKNGAELEKRLAKDRQRLEVTHQQALARIKQSFLDTASDAARRNDAVALLRARRTMQRQVRDEEKSQKGRRTEQAQQAKESRQALERNLATELLDEKRHYKESLRAAAEAHKEQLAELRLAESRRRIEMKIAQDRQLEDFNIAQGRKLDAISRWYDKERGVLSEHYSEVEAAQAAHLGRMAARQAMINYAQAQSQAVVSLPTPRPRSGRRHYRGEGGTDLVTRPTTFIAGERGPEIHQWSPLGQSVHFSSDPFNVNVGGITDPRNEQAISDVLVRMLGSMARQIR